MTTNIADTLFNKENLEKLFPKNRTDEFFEALFGDAAEGAYDIELTFKDAAKDTLNMELHLHQRPGCCLACNLTQGLPQVFSRHPVINIDGLVRDIDKLLGDSVHCESWGLGRTVQHSQALHAIPITITLKRD